MGEPIPPPVGTPTDGSADADRPSKRLNSRWHRQAQCDTVSDVTEGVSPWPDLCGGPFDEAAM